jgi:hypothetical protein
VTGGEVWPKQNDVFFVMLEDEGKDTLLHALFQVDGPVHCALRYEWLRNVAHFVYGLPNQEFLREFGKRLEFLSEIQLRN